MPINSHFLIPSDHIWLQQSQRGNWDALISTHGGSNCFLHPPHLFLWISANVSILLFTGLGSQVCCLGLLVVLTHPPIYFKAFHPVLSPIHSPIHEACVTPEIVSSLLKKPAANIVYKLIVRDLLCVFSPYLA